MPYFKYYTHFGRGIAVFSLTWLLLPLMLTLPTLPSKAHAGSPALQHNLTRTATQAGLFLSSRFGSKNAWAASNTPTSEPSNFNAQTENAEEGADDFLRGSFLGAVLFGHPYEGPGLADGILIAALALLAVNLVVARRKGADKGDRFTVGDKANESRQSGNPKERSQSPWFRNENTPPANEDSRKEQGLTKRGDPLRPREPLKKDPWDNAWSRKIRGEDTPKIQGDTPDDQRGPTRQHPVTVKDRAEAMWAFYSSNPEQQAHEQKPTQGSADVSRNANVPAGFDVQEFLEGARTLYVRLQQAWAARRLDSLTPFVTDGMMRILQKQASAHPTPDDVAISRVNATLEDVLQTGDGESASVSFAALISAEKDTAPAEVRESWIFVRGPETQGMWRLSGIKAAE